MTADTPLKFHPFADIFPLMEGEEFDALVEDIKRYGQYEPITVYQGKVLDGRNRYNAARIAMKPDAGVRLDDSLLFDEFDGDDDDARAFVISKNLCRRHLTAEQRRAALVAIVAAQPEKSDRAIAREVGAGVDHKQVGRARRKAESTGAIDPVDKRKGADGRKRRQPKQPEKREKAPRRRSREWWRQEAEKNREAAERRGRELAEAQAKDLAAATSAAAPAPAPGSWDRWQDEAAAAAQATAPADGATATKPERSEILAADLRWAANVTAANREAARRLYDLLADEERRAAFVAALGRAIGAAGNGADPAASAERMKEGFAEEGDDEERPRRRKKKEVETTLEQALADAFEDLSGLGEECQEVVDNAAPGLDQTQRIQTLDETANALGSLEQPDVPSELEGLLVKYFPLTKSRQSRADRCGAACAIIEACIEALATVTESDPRHAAASDLSSELDGAMSTAIECEFPGMYG
jgi:hypothetical protein